MYWALQRNKANKLKKVQKLLFRIDAWSFLYVACLKCFWTGLNFLDWTKTFWTKTCYFTASLAFCPIFQKQIGLVQKYFNPTYFNTIRQNLQISLFNWVCKIRCRTSVDISIINVSFCVKYFGRSDIFIGHQNWLKMKKYTIWTGQKIYGLVHTCPHLCGQVQNSFGPI